MRTYFAKYFGKGFSKSCSLALTVPFKMDKPYKEDCVFYMVRKCNDYRSRDIITVFFYFNKKTSTAFEIGSVMQIKPTLWYYTDNTNKQISILFNNNIVENYNKGLRFENTNNSLINEDVVSMNVGKQMAMSLITHEYIEQLKFFMENMYLL